MPDRPLRLGTRRSPLAMAQAHETRDLLQAAHPDLTIEIVPVLASGDKVLDRPLAEIGGKALWTKELDAWLQTGEIDIAVHSAKDVETLRPAEFVITAVLPRADVRDVLILRQDQDEREGVSGLAALPPGARIGTSAPRRAAQALHARPDCRIVLFRGNVATRLGKLEAGEADATLLAAAGLERLEQTGIGTPLDPLAWMPAPGQGAIAIECRTEDSVTRDLLAAIDHAPSHAALLAERGLLAALGGNCHSPIAALTTHGDNTLLLRAALFSPDGAHRVDGELSFPPGDPQGPVRLARQLLDAAPPAVREHFAG